MVHSPKSSPQELSGDRLAAMQMIQYAMDILQQTTQKSGGQRRGPRVEYVPFDPLERVQEVLRYQPHERALIDRIQNEETYSPGLKKKRIHQLSKRFRAEHMGLFATRLVAQKLALAKMQLQVRGILEEHLFTENDEVLSDVFDRVGSFRAQSSTLVSLNDHRRYPLSDYVELFPAGTFHIAENGVNVRQLHDVVDETADVVRLPSRVIADYRKMYTAMVGQSHELQRFRERYPNDRKFFRACFGFFPLGDIEIIQGPLSFYIRCHAIEDYAKVYAGERNGSDATHRQVQHAALTSGVALGGRCRVPAQVRNGITLEQNDTESLFLADQLTVYRHEEDHIYNRFFTAPWMNLPTTFPPGHCRSVRGVQASSRAYIRDALDICRLVEVAQSGKDEVLAQFGEGRSFESILSVMRESGPNSFYDFVTRARDDIRETGATRSSPFTLGKLMQERLEEPYDRALEAAMTALEELQQMGFERDFISELLRVEPLEQWPRLVRLIQQTS